jgi:hypothetical protein
VSAAVLAVPPVVDGQNIPSEFPAAIATQDTNTQFGNNFNELDQLFVTAEAGNVYLGLSGNIADNNMLFVYIDTTPGNNPAGEVLDSENGGGCPGNLPTALRASDGTRFDAGFDPDYVLTISVGKFPGHSDWQLVAACDLTKLTDLTVTPLGIGALESGNGILTGATGSEVSINSSNFGGVTDYCFPAQPPFCAPLVSETGSNPAEVTTGIEVKLPRTLLGNFAPNSNVAFFAFITNNAYNGGGTGPCSYGGYASNQALPGLGGNGNLATFHAGQPIDFSGPQGPGTQFVTAVVP